MKNKKPEIIKKAKKIKVFAMDIDGVLTDGSLIFCNEEEIKSWNVKDRITFFILHRLGYKTLWISGRGCRDVKDRANDLKITEVFLNVKDKLKIFRRSLKKLRVTPEEVLYAGDDLVDLSILKRAGLSACPEDAASDVRKNCDIVTRCAGGAGVLRELAEFVLKSQNKWKKALEYYAF